MADKGMLFSSSKGDLHLCSEILWISLVFIYSEFSAINYSTALRKTQIFESSSYVQAEEFIFVFTHPCRSVFQRPKRRREYGLYNAWRSL